jgi:WD40 repeat protein
VRLWDTATGIEVLAFPNDLGGIAELKFSPDGERLAAAGVNSVVKVWDTATGALVQTVKGHAAPLIELSFNDDGTRLYTVDESGVAKEWDVPPPALPAPESLRLCTYSADGSRRATYSPVVGAGRNGSPEVHVLDAAGTEILCFKDHAEGVFQAVMSPDGRCVLSADIAGVWKLWDADTGKVRRSLAWDGNLQAFQQRMQRRAQISADGRFVAVPAADGGAQVWRCADGHEVFAAEGNLTELSISPDGRRLVAHDYEVVGKPGDRIQENRKEMRLWDIPGRKLLAAVPGHFTNVVFSPDGRRVAAWSWLKRQPNGLLFIKCTGLKVWDADTGAELTSLDPGTRRMGTGGPLFREQAVFNPDGTRLALTHGNSILPQGSPEFTVYEVPSGKVVQHARSQAREVQSLAYSPDGRRLVAYFNSSRGATAEIKMWDTATGSELLRLTPQYSRNTNETLAFSPDGTRLFLRYFDRAQTWDATPRAEK